MATRQDRKLYSFKSVGATSDSLTRERRIAAEPTPIGLKTPLQLGNGTNIFKMHYSLEDSIKDNLRNLVMTNTGERLGRPNFGANLMELALELGTESSDQQAMMRIKEAAATFLPFVNLVGFASEVDRFDNQEVAKVDLFITYTIPKISAKQHGLKITLYTAG